MKPRLIKPIVCAFATVSLAFATLGTGIAGMLYQYEGQVKEAKALDNYRAEETTKVQAIYDQGRISKSEYDRQLSLINAMEDDTIIDLFIEGKSEHSNCCEKIYKELVKDFWIGMGIYAGTLATGFGTYLTGYITKEEFSDYKSDKQMYKRTSSPDRYR